MLRLEVALPSVEDLACILHKCRKEKNLAHALRLHAYTCGNGLDTHTLLGNSLVSMLVEVGNMCRAQQVFDRLVHRDESSWNSLIIGYVKHGESQHAFTLYEMMEKDGSLHPCGYTFVALLKASTILKDIERGLRLHADIARKGLLEDDVFIGSTMVDMYAKCGSLAKAQEVFDNIPVRNIVSWNALITGYVEHGHGEEALQLYEQMQQDGISSDAVTLVCSLKACGSIGSIVKGQIIHAEVARKGLLEENVFVGSALVGMYAKCGSLAEAQEVFDKLPIRNVVSWTALIAGYAEHGHGKEALDCHKQMQHKGISPHAATLVCSLKACGCIEATCNGQEIHAEITRKGLERDILVGNTLVDMYVKCGLLVEAQDVLDKLPVQTMVSWTALIAGFVEYGHGEKALNCFEIMQLEGITPDAATLVCSLKACGTLRVTVKGHKLHAEIAKKGLLEIDIFIGITLVHMYAKCGAFAEAQDVFDNLPVRTVVSWNALIAGYAEHGHGKEALICLEQMQYEGIPADGVTLVCSLKVCGSVGDKVKGRELHAEIARKGLERELLIGNFLVDMYAGCGSLAEAQEVLEKLPVRTAVSWTALIAGYVEHGHGEEALYCFNQIQHENIFLNAVIFVCILRACGNIGATNKGLEIHAEIVRKGVLARDVIVGSTLVAIYAKYGLLAEAHKVLDMLPIRDLVSWTALIKGYVEHMFCEEGLCCLKQMQHEGISPDAVTFVCCLSACGSIGATVKGLEIHAEIAKRGLERELVICNSLIDMYAKCGSLATAQKVFDKLSVRDVVSWNALITGYAQLGESENVFLIFDRMIGENKKPDLFTFFSVLNACSHAGLVDKGQMYFEAISDSYGLIPTFEHYTCMVDLIFRAGHIDKAVAMISKMPYHPGLVMWHIVLSACRKWGNVELGRHAFEHAMRLNEKDAAAYVSMSNIYADAAMQEDAGKETLEW